MAFSPVEFIPLLIVFISAALFFVGRRVVREQRSRAPSWPGSLGEREQAYICEKYFRRHGIIVRWPPPGMPPYDLELRIAPRRRIFMKFRSAALKLTESHMREMRKQKLTLGPEEVYVVIVQTAMNSVESDLARSLDIPVYQRNQINDLRILIQSDPKDFAAALRELSPVFATVSTAEVAQSFAIGLPNGARDETKH